MTSQRQKQTEGKRRSITGRPQRQRLEEARQGPPLEPAEGARPCSHLDFRHLVSRAGREHTSVGILEAAQLWRFVMGATGPPWGQLPQGAVLPFCLPGLLFPQNPLWLPTLLAGPLLESLVPSHALYPPPTPHRVLTACVFRLSPPPLGAWGLYYWEDRRGPRLCPQDLLHRRQFSTQSTELQ